MESCAYRLGEDGVCEGLHDLRLELAFKFPVGHLGGLLEHLVGQLLVDVPDVGRLQALQVLLQRHLVESLLSQAVVI